MQSSKGSDTAQTGETDVKVSRQEAARLCVAVFDTGFFKALCEPARIAALRELILWAVPTSVQSPPACPKIGRLSRAISSS
jgi:hypothetical protein